MVICDAEHGAGDGACHGDGEAGGVDGGGVQAAEYREPVVGLRRAGTGLLCADPSSLSSLTSPGLCQLHQCFLCMDLEARHLYAIVWNETRRVGVVAAGMEGKRLAMTVLTVLPLPGINCNRPID